MDWARETEAPLMGLAEKIALPFMAGRK